MSCKSYCGNESAPRARWLLAVGLAVLSVAAVGCVEEEDARTALEGQRTGSASIVPAGEGSLRWSKEDEHWDLLGGATFEVCRTWDWVDSTLLERIEPYCFEVTDNDALDDDSRDGVIVIDDLPLGTYEIREISAPPGYEPSEETHEVTLTPDYPDDPEAEAFMNNPLLGSLRWSKEDEHWDLLGGATFEVCRTHDWDFMEGMFVERVEPRCFEVTDNDSRDSDAREGVIVVDEVVLGKYAIREIAAPPGYEASAEIHYVELSPDYPDDLVAEAFMNEPLIGSLRWSKEDENWDLLGGATFEVCRTHDWDFMVSDFVELVEPVCFDITDNDAMDDDPAAGVIKVEDLRLGKYQIRETVPPPGYEGTDEIHYVELTPDYPDDLVAEAFMNERLELSGCTLGFFKNHEYLWDEPTDPLAIGAGFTTSTDFHTFFGLTPLQSGLPADLTMLGALELGGGGRFNLARQGVAALLNLGSGFAYDYGDDAGALIAEIRAKYLTCAGMGYANSCYGPLATALDLANNYGCLIDPQPELKPKPNGNGNGNRR